MAVVMTECIHEQMVNMSACNWMRKWLVSGMNVVVLHWFHHGIHATWFGKPSYFQAARI